MQWKLESDELTFLARLNVSPDGRFLLGLLLKEIEFLNVRSRNQDSPAVFRTLGAADALAGVISKCEGARAILEGTAARPRMPRRLVNSADQTE